MIDSAESIAVGPKWSARDRDSWLDLFTNFAACMVGATIDEGRGLKAYPEEQLKTDLTLAAELADFAMQEVQYRFHKHPNQAKQRVKGKRR